MKRSLVLLTCVLTVSARGDESVARPPEGAIILFDGNSTDQWQHRSGQPCHWRLADGYMEAKGGDLLTKRKFRDFRLHVEFWIPKVEKDGKRRRSNSGVYIHDRYEIQILDTYDRAKLGPGDCGAIYRRKAVDVDARRPAEQWQTYDITFRAPRFDDQGKVVEHARVTVLWNGVKVHDDVEIEGPTGRRKGQPMLKEGPIVLQDHGYPLRFRNIWLVEL